MENFSSSAPAEFDDAMEEAFDDAMEEAFEDTNENINAVNESDPPPQNPANGPMQLLPPSTSGNYPTLEALIQAVNKHTAEQGYTVVKGGLKRNKDKEIVKNLLKCSRGGVYKNTVEPEERQRDKVVKSTGCKWEAYGRKDGDVWVLVMKRSSHNHPAAAPESFPVHRKMTDDNIKTVRIDRQRNLSVYNIAEGLHISNPDRFFKKQDIYNAISTVR